MSLIDALILALVGLIVVAVVIILVVSKKKGKSSCGCDCSRCKNSNCYKITEKQDKD